MTIKAYGILESLKSTTTQQTKHTGKGHKALTGPMKTQEALFAAFRLKILGKSAEDFGLQSGFQGLTGLSGSGNTEVDLSKYQYNGRSILDFSQEEASAMISEDGDFGVKKTAKRLADFVVNGAGDNLDRLRAGREGMLKGFKDAEELWGGTLPDISYKTLEAALAQIDDQIQKLGGQVVDTTV
jgi:hypothetical protein